MALKFNELGYCWTVREGLPPMGSTEAAEPTFVDSLRATSFKLKRYTDRELASWIVARLNYLTAGGLINEGTEFRHDTNEFGYKVKITDSSDQPIAHGAIMIHETRIYFAAVNVAIADFQSVFVELLTANPDDLAKIRIRVQFPETKRYRSYGWDGYALISG